MRIVKIGFRPATQVSGQHQIDAITGAEIEVSLPFLRRNVFVGVGFVRPVYKKRMMSDQDPAPVFPGVPELLFEPIVLLPALPGVSRFYDRRIQADHATPFLTENETIAAVPADKILHRFGRGFVPYVAGARQQINRDFRIDPAAQYVDGILRAWRAQGITTIDAARRQGQLEGSNIVMTERPNAQPPAASAQKDLFNRNWAAMFDEEG